MMYESLSCFAASIGNAGFRQVRHNHSPTIMVITDATHFLELMNDNIFIVGESVLAIAR